VKSFVDAALGKKEPTLYDGIEDPSESGAAAKEFVEGVKETLRPGESLTLSVPGKKAVTITPEGVAANKCPPSSDSGDPGSEAKKTARRTPGRSKPEASHGA
jgi:hypothetical protein